MYFQKVNILPHVKYSQYENVLCKLRDMMISIEVEDCACSVFRNLSENSYAIELDSSIQEKNPEEAVAKHICFWPSLHSDIASLKETGQIQQVPQGQLLPDASRTRVGHSERRTNLLLDEDKIITAVVQRAEDICDFLYNGLVTKVYRHEDEVMIKNVKTLLSNQNLMEMTINRGSLTVANLTWRKFLEAALFVDSQLLNCANEDEL